MHDIVTLVRGGLPAEDPRLSPAFARFPGLPCAYVSVGRDEILLDDARMLAQALARDGAKVDLHELDGALHVLAFFAPLVPEARAEVRRIGAWASARAQDLVPDAIR
jgi:acetyl esterase/lipase